MTQNTLIAGDATTPFLVHNGGNDGTLAVLVGPTASRVTALSFAADGTPAFAKGPLASMARVNTNNGVGSTNTAIRRWSNITNGVNGCVIQGTDITVADSATLGTSFTVNTAGVYAMMYCDNFASTSTFGISLNTTQPTVEPYLIPVAELLAIAQQSVSAGYRVSCSTTVYLPAGSVVRAHSAGSTSSAANALFTITRVA
jgi:hypothetical protein